MNVVRLFPSLDDERSASLEPEWSAPKQRSAPPSLEQAHSIRVRGASSPVDLLVGAMRSSRPVRGRAPTPAEVIARSLDRPNALEGFWAIWLAHQNSLRRRSLRLSGGNRADAEDALGATMVRAAQAFERQTVRNPGAWLVRILHNTCMDQHRLNAHRAPIEADDEDLPPSTATAWIEETPSPEEVLSRREAAVAWARAMSALPDILIQPLRLHLDDWSDERIAAHLGISRELVRKRRQLARNQLRLLLDV